MLLELLCLMPHVDCVQKPRTWLTRTDENKEAAVRKVRSWRICHSAERDLVGQPSIATLNALVASTTCMYSSPLAAGPCL